MSFNVFMDHYIRLNYIMRHLNACTSLSYKKRQYSNGYIPKITGSWMDETAVVARQHYIYLSEGEMQGQGRPGSYCSPCQQSEHVYRAVVIIHRRTSDKCDRYSLVHVPSLNDSNIPDLYENILSFYKQHSLQFRSIPDSLSVQLHSQPQSQANPHKSWCSSVLFQLYKPRETSQRAAK